MCFEFGSCFGSGRREDYGGEPSTPKIMRGARGRGRRAHHGNGYYTVPAPAYHHQPDATAVGEEGHKAYHDGARKDHYVVAGAGGHGGYDTPKLPAPWHNKVGDEAGSTYMARLHETAPGRRENATVDYHQYPTTTTNTTLVRY